MKAFKIIGIAIRTTNQNNQAQKDINDLWNKWYQEHIASRIPNKTSDALINMYTDYESDENGPYTCILGYQVETLDSIPKGLVGKTIPRLKYKEFISQGKLPDCVLDTWKTIWDLNFDRSYQADFDLYELDKMNPNNATVKTYLSIN